MSWLQAVGGIEKMLDQPQCTPEQIRSEIMRQINQMLDYETERLERRLGIHGDASAATSISMRPASRTDYIAAHREWLAYKDQVVAMFMPLLLRLPPSPLVIKDPNSLTVESDG